MSSSAFLPSWLSVSNRSDWLERTSLAIRQLDAGAGATLHELPGVALEIHGRSPLAGRAGARGAVVLAFQRDAKALLLVRGHGGIGFRLGQGASGGNRCKRSRDGASEDERTDNRFH